MSRKISVVDRIKSFWVDEKLELKKVMWPDKNKVLQLSLALGVTLILLILIISLYDFIFGILSRLILGSFTG
ncbi:MULTISPECIES: preprotein translocase subunit SecE [Dictyoglomus]|uniref:Protein translocase subunit SecE n=1 Tax=Dictyoglomus turgidum (strain DSM 6724 / Z-1310) TaxID=515635 RepID=B8E0K5_DICTD|nr:MULTISPECIES: preprotein translocase subunit SecE [Dictyoglomus]ACK42650.1 preprotein translocase, SecE subunit [Dictyoglomus turgidum DSM 6724]PNV78955.1 MAG: preprotein translocase subunit SecE [Dictyoglomus turgidum]HBU31123.1 preprotein translocase subunit SecE [Dictyoglomus sp.]